MTHGGACACAWVVGKNFRITSCKQFELISSCFAAEIYMYLGIWDFQVEVGEKGAGYVVSYCQFCYYVSNSLNQMQLVSSLWFVTPPFFPPPPLIPIWGGNEDEEEGRPRGPTEAQRAPSPLQELGRGPHSGLNFQSTIKGWINGTRWWEHWRIFDNWHHQVLGCYLNQTKFYFGLLFCKSSIQKTGRFTWKSLKTMC